MGSGTLSALNWREAGSGEAVVFLHGFPFNSSQWQPQLAAVPAGWRFIAPDLRGFGQSAGVGSGSYTMDMFADDVVALMDELSIGQAVICGLSMGGYVTFSLVMRYPKRVRALILAATRANADSPAAAKARLDLAKLARAQGVQPVISSMLSKLVSDTTREQRPEVVEHIRAMMEATHPETMARTLEGMAQRTDYSSSLGQINKPVLVIRGEQDALMPAGDVEMLARSVRGTRHEVIPGVGHVPNLEAPEMFNRLLEQHLAQVARPAL